MHKLAQDGQHCLCSMLQRTYKAYTKGKAVTCMCLGPYILDLQQTITVVKPHIVPEALLI